MKHRKLVLADEGGKYGRHENCSMSMYRDNTAV
jgi:hypothetical protein